MLIVIKSRVTGKEHCIDKDLWNDFYVATGRSKTFTIVKDNIVQEPQIVIDIVEKSNKIEYPLPEETLTEAEKPKRQYKKRSQND